MVKRFVSVLLVVVMVCCMATSVGAASLSGTAEVTFSSYGFSDYTADFDFPRASYSTGYSSAYFKRISSVNVPPSVDLGAVGTVSFYISFYYYHSGSILYRNSSNSSITVDEFCSNILDLSNWYASYYDMNASTVNDGDVISISQFVAGDGSSNYSPGFGITVRFEDCQYLSGLYLFNSYVQYAHGNPTSTSSRLAIPSISVITTETSADVEALENIADQIAAGNDLAQAMYGDIMAALNSIKGDTATMASYLSQALTALNSIKSNTAGIYTLCSTYLQYLAQIASTSESIDAELKAYHEDFMAMMETLQGTIMEESDDIQAKMEEIYNLLIAYLDSQYASAVNPDLIESTGNAQLDINRQEELEVGFQSNLTESWTDLKLETFALGGGYTSAVAWVSSWFSNFYNAMGDYGMILLLPLYIGIVTLVAGLARQAIRRSGRSDQSRGGKKDA